LSGLLARQASKWKAQEGRGELPDALYAALSEGHASGYERRIIRNLARVSRIINDDGTIRPYAVFSLDWVYRHSVYGEVQKCQLCGHEPIVENCVLENTESGESIYIGNTCVLRYIEVRDKNGNIMTAREKADYLKGEMGEAKTEFRRQDFASRFPTAMRDLAKYEPMMKERKALKTLHAKVMSRIVKYGYLGPKIDAEFAQFMLTAEDDYNAWRADNQRRLEERQARNAATALKVAQMRNEWAKEADGWIESVNDLTLNSWEQGMVQRVERHIRNRGRASIRHGMARFVEEIEARVKLEDGEASNPLARELLSIDAHRLNEWEQGFVTSVVSRLECGRSLSKGQQAVVEKLKKKHLPHAS